MTHLIRTFIYTDLATVKNLVYRTIDVSYSGCYPETAIVFFKEYHGEECILADALEGRTLILEESGAILATGTLLGTNIRRMFVDPAQQGRGLGSVLLAHLEEHACHVGLTKLDLSASLPARDFYLRRGYSIVSEEAISLPGGEELHYYAMSKVLP